MLSKSYLCCQKKIITRRLEISTKRPPVKLCNMLSELSFNKTAKLYNQLSQTVICSLRTLLTPPQIWSVWCIPATVPNGFPETFGATVKAKPAKIRKWPLKIVFTCSMLRVCAISCLSFITFCILATLTLFWLQNRSFTRISQMVFLTLTPDILLSAITA